VVLGTHELSFKRLLEEVEEQIASRKLSGEIVVQNGHTVFKSKKMKFIPFMSYKEMEELYQHADLIITHGGTGSITTGIKLGKKMIAVPRLKKYGEHNDDHQLEIVSQFTKSGHILQWSDGESLGDVITESVHFTPAPFKSGRIEILSILENFIDNKA